MEQPGEEGVNRYLLTGRSAGVKRFWKAQKDWRKLPHSQAAPPIILDAKRIFENEYEIGADQEMESTLRLLVADCGVRLYVKD